MMVWSLVLVMLSFSRNLLKLVVLNKIYQEAIQDLNHSSDIDYSASLGNTNLPGDSEPLEMTGEQGDAFRGKYIRRLTAVVIHHVPAFWKVSVSVFSGKFAKASQVSSDSNVNVSAKRTEEKVGDGKYCSHSLDEVAGMLQSTLSAYGSEVSKMKKGEKIDVKMILTLLKKIFELLIVLIFILLSNFDTYRNS